MFPTMFLIKKERVFYRKCVLASIIRRRGESDGLGLQIFVNFSAFRIDEIRPSPAPNCTHVMFIFLSHVDKKRSKISKEDYRIF